MNQDYTDAVPFPEEVLLRPMAVVRAPYTERFGTPRQAHVPGVEPVLAEVHLLPRYPVELLRDLESFERIWLLAWFHLNSPRRKPLVRPPRGGPARGALGTRSPHRPNPLGLSCVELLGIDGRVLQVRGIDLLDGTPLLDIKPYIADYDAFPEAGRGWLTDARPLPPQQPPEP